MDWDQILENGWPDYHTDPVGHCVYALRHGNEMERCNASDILRGLAVDAEPALPIIIEFMRNDPSNQVRAYCAHALADIGHALRERASSAVLPLMAALAHDTDPEVRSLAAFALRSIGPAATKAMPVLSKALEDQDEWVRQAAQEALNSFYASNGPSETAI